MVEQQLPRNMFSAFIAASDAEFYVMFILTAAYN